MSEPGLEENHLRRRLKLLGTTALIGIALSVGESQTLGGVVVVASIVGLVWNLHRFGRLGADRGSGSGLAA